MNRNWAMRVRMKLASLVRMKLGMTFEASFQLTAGAAWRFREDDDLDG